MRLLVRLALCLLVGLPALGMAQTADAPVTPSQSPTLPPLLTAPPEAPPAPRAPEAAPIPGELIPREPRESRPNYLVPRILTGTLLGTLGGAGGGALGFLVGINISGCDVFDHVCDVEEMIPVFAPTIFGAGALSSLAVYAMGSLLHGEGSIGLTFLGGFAGAGLGLLIAPLAGYGGLLFIPPLSAVGALIAYEISDSRWEREQRTGRGGDSSFQLIPVLGATPGGGVLGGVTGRF